MAAGGEEQRRVTTLELFFDLVFVFTITQLTSSLVHHPDLEGVAQVVLMLMVIWWMYDAFAWLTNAVPPSTSPRRLLLLAAMGCFFAISLAIPTAFSGDGEIFGIAYLVVVAIHAGLYTQSADWNTRAIFAFARFNVLIGLLVLAAGVVGDEGVEYALWALAVVLIVVTPLTVDAPEDWIRPDHFLERHGLVVIVALGESVVAVGIGASGLEITAELLAVAGLGLALTADLWWSYFGDREELMVRALAETPGERRFMVAMGSFYYAHGLILIGIIGVAAGLEEAIAHAFDPLHLAQALFLAAGIATFFAGNLLFQRLLRVRSGPWQAIAGILALATIPLGTEGSALLQLAAITLAVTLCVIADTRDQAQRDAFAESAAGS
jgi:low temperature requirement protein LtrA